MRESFGQKRITMLSKPVTADNAGWRSQFGIPGLRLFIPCGSAFFRSL